MANQDQDFEVDVPPEIIEAYFVANQNESGGAAKEPPPKTGRRAAPPPEEAPDEPDDYDDDPGEEAPAPLNNEQLGEILDNTHICLERLRTIGNVTVNMDSHLVAICSAFGIEKGGKKGDGKKAEDNDSALVKEIDRKLTDLIENGFSAQLSAEFDHLRPERTKALLDAIDKKLQSNYAIGKSYRDNLQAAMKSATATAVKWGCIAGVGGSILCAVVNFLLSSLL